MVLGHQQPQWWLLSWEYILPNLTGCQWPCVLFTVIVQVVEIVPQGKQAPVYYAVTWPMMCWICKEPEHQQAWYWPCLPKHFGLSAGIVNGIVPNSCYCSAQESPGLLSNISTKYFYLGTFYMDWLTLITPRISDQIPSEVWDKIPDPFPNFNGCIFDVWEWISYFIWHIIKDVITLE